METQPIDVILATVKTELLQSVGCVCTEHFISVQVHNEVRFEFQCVVEQRLFDLHLVLEVGSFASEHVGGMLQNVFVAAVRAGIIPHHEVIH
jgi:hypothetical protein